MAQSSGNVNKMSSFWRALKEITLLEDVCLNLLMALVEAYVSV